MFGFGKDKKKEEEEEKEAKAEQEKVAQAMRNMSDQLASKGKEVADLQKQLEAAKKDASAGDAAEKALAEAQAKVRQMQAEMAKLQIQAQSAQNKAKQAAAAAAKVEAKPEPGVSLGGAAGAAPGMLGVGVSAWVRNAGGKNLRLRDNHGLDTNAFAGLPPGTKMTLLEGPVEDDGYPWWRVRVDDGREGWVAGTELVTQPE